jgi:hypothetical protein
MEPPVPKKLKTFRIRKPLVLDFLIEISKLKRTFGFWFLKIFKQLMVFMEELPNLGPISLIF